MSKGTAAIGCIKEDRREAVRLELGQRPNGNRN
jgi:hypothetical protein